jgi:hypothetical protein
MNADVLDAGAPEASGHEKGDPASPGERGAVADARVRETDVFENTMLRETLTAVLTPGADNDDQLRRGQAAIAVVRAFKPRDEIEGMLAAQTTALHFSAMECLRQATTPGLPIEIGSKLRRDGANLCRATTEMLDALDRKRGKGPQVVRVERVVVQDSAQAIIGNLSPPAAVAPAPPKVKDVASRPGDLPTACAAGRGDGQCRRRLETTPRIGYPTGGRLSLLRRPLRGAERGLDAAVLVDRRP